MSKKGFNIMNQLNFSNGFRFGFGFWCAGVVVSLVVIPLLTIGSILVFAIAGTYIQAMF